MNNAEEDYFSSKFIKRINPFDEEDNIVDLNGDRGTMHRLTNRNPTWFSRRPFVELHTYYGIQFQNFFNSRQQTKCEIVNDLILL